MRGYTQSYTADIYKRQIIMPWDLPPELLLAIGRVTRTADLPSLLRISTFYNHFFTGTLLYSSIELRDFRSTRRCLRTLCKAPADCAFGRDLASLVRSFHTAEFPYNRIRMKSLQALQGMFSRVLPRLINVQAFSTQLVRLLPLCALMDLLRTCSGTLQSLDVSCSGTSEYRRSEDDLQLISQELPSFPQLTLIKLVGVYEKHPLYIQFLQRLSHTVANHIQTLHLDMINNEPELAMLSARETFPALQELKVNGKTFFLPEFPHAAFPRLRTLILRGERFFWQLPFPLDPGLGATRCITHYPELEILCCSARAIPSLFPPDILSRDLPHALHTVELDNPAYVLPKPYEDYVPVGGGEVRAALTLLKSSALPIRHLLFSVASLGDKVEEQDFEEVLPTCMERLETLVVFMGAVWCTQVCLSCTIRLHLLRCTGMPAEHTLSGLGLGHGNARHLSHDRPHASLALSRICKPAAQESHPGSSPRHRASPHEPKPPCARMEPIWISSA